MTSHTFAAGLTLVCLTLVVERAPAEPPKKVLPPAAPQQVDFARDVQPLLAAHCVRCHGPKKSEGGLRLDRKTDALAGGNSGPAFEASKSAASLLIRYVAGLDDDTVMPPSGKRLSAAQVGILRAWIDQGATWPSTAASAEAEQPQSDHWAFRSIARPALPALKNEAWARNPIDHFIRARLEKEKLTPAAEADRVTLIRRLCLDLLGLPPSVAEVDAFLSDQSADAYERLVDRLLASPHYGERWGRHWLDAARYADSDGYNGDGARPAWKYRDWVIDALNRDLAFDRFVIEQLAGDLLPGATVSQKVATGFHRNTLFNAEGGNDPEEFRVERVVDRVATTGVVFLGLTVGCAECHAHKYDPISQREFYELFAFFNNAEEVTVEAPSPEETAARERHRARMAELQAKVQAHDQATRPALGAARTAVGFAGGPLPALRLGSLYVALDPVRQQLLGDLAKLKKQEPAVTRALALAAPAGKPRATRIHIRGDFHRPGATVTPNVPRVLPPLKAQTPTRLDLARWLVAPENPLTARVTVNRVWQQYFGRGLVETENDFGTQGSPPTHPELLDWLASEFMNPTPTTQAHGLRPVGGATLGWSMKHLHRLIVTSAAYRQSSRHRPELAAIDPKNQWLARQTRPRLEAEVVRDVLLSTSGLLSSKIGGPSVFPYQPPGVMETRRSVFPWVQSAGADRHRRTLYTHFWRTSPHPFLMAFDAPKSDTACTRRHHSNTSLQALMLLNDPMFVDCARGLAARVLKEGPTDDTGRTRYAFRTCVAREPTVAEHKILNDFLAQQAASFRADPKAARGLAGADVPAGSDVAQRAAWTALARVLFNLDEVIVRE